MNVSTVITMNYEHKTMNYEIKNEPKRTQFKASSKPISRPPMAIDNGCPVQEIDYEKLEERLYQGRSAVIMLNLSLIKKVVCFE
jgi:hypothetical protein